MSLTKYNQKRSKDKTTEPFGGKPEEEKLRFVVQKHDATQLHYDFRLEMNGVLKSWAVPKGPSTDPKVKRLAMMVEDHPYDYRNFEGIIPKGQYGGGTVIIWDEGTYEPLEEIEGKIAQEKALLKQLKVGSLKFKLKGKKLKGEFALVKTHGMAENAWLLIKHNDRYAKEMDITKKDKSVVSKKTIAQVEKTSSNRYGKTPKLNVESNIDPVKKIEKAVKKKAVKNKKEIAPDLKVLLKGAPKQGFYKIAKPMLATLVNKAFDEEGWLYEIKWDGYRAITFKNKTILELKSRNEQSFKEKFYPIYEALESLNFNAILDGEIVVTNANGSANFAALQNWKSEEDGDIRYYVFDILWYEGYDLKGLQLSQRRAILKTLIGGKEQILMSEEFETSGTEFLEAAKKIGLEGIIAKKKNSHYYTGARSREWLKIKANKRQEVVIGGFTNNDDSFKVFSSLLVGVFENGKLRYTGKIGTGFSDQLQKEMMAEFQPLVTKKVPFSTVPDVNKPNRFRFGSPKARVTWLKPQLICEVSYAEITKDGVMRHPSFEGMRSDKKAKEVILEKETDINNIIRQEAEKQKKMIHVKKIKDRKMLLNPNEETQVKKIEGHELKFTNLNKIFWPIEKYTKRDLINYYHQIAPFILPYLKNRPQSLNRFPNGINAENFYQKDVTGKVPDWMDTYLYHSEGDERDKHFLLGNNEATLLYMAGLGCIEMNPWSSTIKKPDYPTWCIIDFDPDQNSFDQVIEAVLITKQILDDMEVPCYAKTSGSSGMHIYIPLGNKYSYEQAKEFARIIVILVHREIPKYTSLERIVSDRKGKMYLDFLQNRSQATIAAPYTVRPKPGATVSMPLLWEEVKKGLKMKDFTMINALQRINEIGDIFKPVLGKGINLQQLIKKVDNPMQKI